MINNTQLVSILKKYVDEIIIITDKDGMIIWVNDYFSQLTEYSPIEVIGRKPGNFLQGKETDNSTVEQMRMSILKQTPFNVNVVNYSKSGHKYWLNINCKPIFNEETLELEYFVAIERDITQEYESQQKKLNGLIVDLENAEAEKEDVVKLTYMLAHDLKSPLNNIDAMFGLLGESEKTSDLSSFISDEIARMKNLIDKILVSGNAIDGSIKVVPTLFRITDPIKLIIQGYSSSYQKKKLTVYLDADKDLQINTDKVLFEQIIENLFSNSVKYATQGSQVKFSIKQRKESIFIRISNQTDEMDERKIKKLFSPFQNFNYQQTSNSSGLGLYIVKKYTDLIEGQITVEKEDKNRICFVLKLQNLSASSSEKNNPSSSVLTAQLSHS